MPNTNGYVKKESADGAFTCHVRKDVNKLLDIYCSINQINKTNYVNTLIANDMEEKFRRIKEVEA